MQSWTTWECNTVFVSQVHPDKPGADLQQHRYGIWHPNTCDTSDLPCGSEWWVFLWPCGVTVWEASCCSHSSWEWQGGRIDCDGSHCGFGPVLFLSPGPCCCSSTQRKCTRCHLSTHCVVWGAKLSLTSTILFAVYRFFVIYTQETGGWRGPLNWVPTQVWFPELGDRMWD